ncbi:TerC family protein [Blattabacterium cuenoti]|uniref:TerC family protein n=1 Tax=Blattabacterium cuenoti TaxID=1653831 RepID=UPI0021CE5AF7|nr:hypothetical protein [Blattabacterium cuenoti]
MDLAFSIDNIFASVALSDNYLLIFFGIFTGILSIKLIAKFFIQLVKKFPELNNSIFFVIIILGIKLIFSFFKVHTKNLSLDIIFHVFTFVLFIFPIFFSFIKKKVIRKSN